MQIKKNMGSFFLSMSLLLTLNACGGAESSTPTPSIENDDTPVPVVDSVSDLGEENTSKLLIIDASDVDYKVVNLEGSKNKQLHLKLETPVKDVYVVVSNTTNINSSTLSIVHNQKVEATIGSNQKNIEEDFSSSMKTRPNKVSSFNNHSLLSLNNKNLLPSQKLINKETASFKVVELNDTETFYMDVNATTSTTMEATARKIVSSVGTDLGLKSLTIWVEDSSWKNENSGTCLKSKCVTQEMVDALADKFLKEGADNDIYDWMSNVFGAEWGSSEYSNSLIALDNNITILLGDIQNDDATTGGIIGYFYAKDNFKKSIYSGSNERLMFYIDSVMYANGENGWSKNDYWPEQIFSTLAHEFQHMIYYYQKNVKYGLQSTEVWLNEMLSEATEDLLAINMKLSGPRNVSYTRGDAGEGNNVRGRYPLFNKNNKHSLTAWDNTLIDYSKVSSFGAYLLRNYGGAKLLHDIMHNGLSGQDALLYAVHLHPKGMGKSFDDLIHDWGIAILLSKQDSLSSDSVYLYNQGDFIVNEYNNSPYRLGSINFFNYTPIPLTNKNMGFVTPHSNYFYRVGDGLSGDVDINITGMSGLNVSVIIIN